MEKLGRGALGSWLEERCKTKGLSLRQASIKIGISHATVADIINGSRACPETIRKLAKAFSQGGDHHRLVLEDELLVLAGFRSARRAGKGPSESMSILLDKLSKMSEPQLKIVGRFCDFISEESKR